ALALVATPISWAYYLVLAILPLARLVQRLAARRFPMWPSLFAAVSVLVLMPLDGPLVDVAHVLSARLGTPDGQLATLPTLLTLVPGLGIAGVGVLLAWVERCDVPCQ